MAPASTYALIGRSFSSEAFRSWHSGKEASRKARPSLGRGRFVLTRETIVRAPVWPRG